MEKLDPEFKKRWIAALRSGEYKQGNTYLYTETNDSFCCMGVAGAVCGVDRNDMIGFSYFQPSTESASTRIYNSKVPALLQRGGFNGEDLASTLAILNDFHNKSFSQIADYIDENL